MSYDSSVNHPIPQTYTKDANLTLQICSYLVTVFLLLFFHWKIEPESIDHR